MTLLPEYRIWRLLVFAAVLMTGAGCRFNMNFTGGVIDSELKSLNVELFGNEADISVPYLGQEITRRLQDQFLSRSSLRLSPSDPDVILSGAVVRYSIAPVAISGGEVAVQNRLTIGVRVRYENLRRPDDSWERNFEQFVDYGSSANFASIEKSLIETATDQLAQNIFTESLGKW